MKWWATPPREVLIKGRGVWVYYLPDGQPVRILLEELHVPWSRAI